MFFILVPFLKRAPCIIIHLARNAEKGGGVLMSIILPNLNHSFVPVPFPDSGFPGFPYALLIPSLHKSAIVLIPMGHAFERIFLKKLKLSHKYVKQTSSYISYRFSHLKPFNKLAGRVLSGYKTTRRTLIY